MECVSENDKKWMKECLIVVITFYSVNRKNLHFCHTSNMHSLI